MNNISTNQFQPASQGVANIINTLQGDMGYMPSKYSKAFNNYSRNQIKTIMPFIASISRTCSYGSLYPICKVLKAISKIFMLNQIQIIFLAYLIRQTDWDIRDKTIYHNADNVQDIIYYSIDNLDYKRIILYLMITAFTVKFYLNQNTVQILEQANKRCPNFRQIFQGWNKKHSIIITKINPRTLNTVYKKLYSSVKFDQADFNMMVDAIIQISPAYNPQREKQNQQLKKKGGNDRKQVQVVIKKQQPTIKHDKSGFIPVPALFSSSGIFDMTSLHNQQTQQMANLQNNANLSGFNVFMPCKSDRIRQENLGFMGSSVVVGIQGQGYDIKEDYDCGEIDLGLNDGQSQQNIVFEEKVVNTSGVGFQLINQNNIHPQNNTITEQSPYYTSIINLTRRSSGIAGKEGVGSSQIFISAVHQPGSNERNTNSSNKGRKQASVVNLDSLIKISVECKDKKQ